jgi:hypothetical protein
LLHYPEGARELDICFEMIVAYWLWSGVHYRETALKTEMPAK